MNETTKPRRTLRPEVAERIGKGEPPGVEPAAAPGPLRPPSDKQNGFAARFWNRHLGRAVSIVLSNGAKIGGTLKWFDKYDLGVEIEGAGEILVAKHAIISVWPGGEAGRSA